MQQGRKMKSRVKGFLLRQRLESPRDLRGEIVGLFGSAKTHEVVDRHAEIVGKRGKQADVGAVYRGLPL